MLARVKLDRQTLSWALYDWANSAFATTVMAGFFPLFFKSYWSAEGHATESTFQLGVANSVASLMIVLTAPLLGAIADRGGWKKRFLMVLALLGIGATAGLYFVAQGQWLAALFLYVLALLGMMGGNIFYDALLVNIAKPDQLHRVSALGFASGYLGGGLLFAVNIAMTLRPEWFGLASATAAVQVSFLTVAVWWGIFAVPLFLWVPEHPVGRRPLAQGRAWIGGWRQLRATFSEIRKLRFAFLFLGAYWLYIDGVDTVIRMAVDYGMALGLASSSLITALLITQFVGFPAAIAFGALGQRIGAKRGIFFALAVYVGVTLWAYRIEQEWEFYVLAVAVGLVQGGIQALSRSFYASIIPRDRSGEFFGFYNMLGKFAAVIGPVLMGTVGVLSGSPRTAILSVLVLFIAGGLLLYFVDEDEARRVAARL